MSKLLTRSWKCVHTGNETFVERESDETDGISGRRGEIRLQPLQGQEDEERKRLLMRSVGGAAGGRLKWCTAKEWE